MIIVWKEKNDVAFPNSSQSSVKLFFETSCVQAVQLLETPFVNLVNYASLVTTNASRHRIVAGKSKILLEFGLRRAQVTLCKSFFQHKIHGLIIGNYFFVGSRWWDKCFKVLPHRWFWCNKVNFIIIWFSSSCIFIISYVKKQAIDIYIYIYW